MEVRKLILGLLFVLGLIQCSQSKHESLSSGNEGQVTIGADETLQPMVEAAKVAYEHLNPNAHITVLYLPEANLVNLLCNDSIEMIIATRELNDKEKSIFETRKFSPPVITLGYDGLALIGNKTQVDTSLSFNQVFSLWKGEISTWSELGSHDGNSVIMVFDNQNSSTTRFVLDTIKMKILPKNAYAVKKHSEVIDYVATHPGSIGLVGWNWLSDSDDPLTRDQLNKIKVFSISAKDSTQFYKPYPFNLQTGSYPFRRKVIAINAEARSGLATGFAGFLFNDIGQKIVTKAGLLPNRLQKMDVIIKEEAIK